MADCQCWCHREREPYRCANCCPGVRSSLERAAPELCEALTAFFAAYDSRFDYSAELSALRTQHAAIRKAEAP